MIPTSESRALFAAANEPKKLLIFPGAGHNVFGSMGQPYLDQVEQFIRESLRNPTTVESWIAGSPMCVKVVHPAGLEPAAF